MGIMVYSLLWVMQDLYHQQKYSGLSDFAACLGAAGKKRTTLTRSGSFKPFMPHPTVVEFGEGC